MFQSVLSSLFISFFILLFSNNSAFTLSRIDSLEHRTPLAGLWKIKYDDNEKYALPRFDDSQWGTISLPGKISNKSIRKKTDRIDGIVWIRKTVYISKDARRKDGIGLILGRIANADETYFNGIQVGKTGTFPPEHFSMWNHPRHYPVPDIAIKYGEKNVISIRIYGHTFLEVLGTLAITNYNDWNSNRLLENFFTITINYIFIYMHIILIFIFYLLYIRRKEEVNLYFCLQLICGLFIILELCNFWNIYYNNDFRLKLLIFFWVALNVVHPIFLHRIYSLIRKKTEKILWCYLAFVIVGFFTFQGHRAEILVGLIIIMFTTCIGFYNISCHISALRKRRPYSKIFSILCIITIITAMHDGVAYLSKLTSHDITIFRYAFERMFFGAGTVAFLIGTSLVLIHRIINVLEDNDDLIRTLENLFFRNSMLQREINSQKGKYSLSLTNRLEEKIKKAVTYVEDNYRSDISREGLAASIDLHPDNLGRLFIRYKNKKIGEYINELRIKDAARQLIETNDSIEDISQSVGFENLRTFTRLFPKFMNTTPNAYRKHHRIEVNKQ